MQPPEVPILSNTLSSVEEASSSAPSRRPLPLLRFGDDPMSGIEGCIRAGGDTDSHAAIVGGWLGALHGASALPMPLVRRIQDGPFGPSHLERLAAALVDGAPPPSWSWPHALLRNLALHPVVLAHGFARLVPW